MDKACTVHIALMRFFSFFRLGFDRVEKKGRRTASLHYNRYSPKIIAIILILISSLLSTALLQLENSLIILMIFGPLFSTALILSLTTVSVDLDFSSKKIASTLFLAGNIISTCSIGSVQKRDIKLFKVKKIIRKPFESHAQYVYKLIFNKGNKQTAILISRDACLTLLLKLFQEKDESQNGTGR
ncbi:MAG: hypothetical protein ACTSRU_05050 [Candidatus Hodarchaeales archaeon]